MIDLEKYPFFKKYDPALLYDVLTGAMTREMFFDYANHLIEIKKPFAMYFIDFDDFKKINDNLGHQVGDQALKDAVSLITEGFQGKGILFRFGGDEFVAIVDDIKHYEDVWSVARAYTENVRKHPLPYLKDVFAMGKITITSGITRYPKDADNLKDLFALSDKALYRGKSKGKNCFIVYVPQLHKNISIENKNSTLSLSGIFAHVFNEFAKEDTFENRFKYVTYFVGNYYQVNHISYFDDEKDILGYGEEVNGEIIYRKMKPDFFHENQKEEYKIYYRRICQEVPYLNPVFKTMEGTKIGSMVILKVRRSNHKTGYLRIDSTREKVWTDEEILVYEMISNILYLVSTIENRYANK